MINFLILLLFTVLSFVLLTLFRKYHDYFVLMAISIGCGVNACVYSSYSHPVILGSVYFSIDSVLYSLFLFTLIITLKDYGRPSFKTMAISTIVAILISGTIELFAQASTLGCFNSTLLFRYLSFVFSSIGSYLGIWLMATIFKSFQKKNINLYLTFVICFIVGCFINSCVTYGYLLLINRSAYSNVGLHITGDLLLKGLCLGLGCLSYYINYFWWKPNLNEK